MTILLFFAVLFVLILVHEWGHFIVAKKTGMRVDEFGIGFPPKLFGKKWHGTEYTLNALPIGGFVRIWGENAEDAALAEEGGENVSDAFTAKSKWAQAAVLVAGVTMNILFAWLLFVIVFMLGVPTAVSPEEASENAALTVTSVVNDSPAQEAGVPHGAKIVAVSQGTTQLDTLTPAAFLEFTSGATEALTVRYEVDGVEMDREILPETGVLATNPDRPAVGLALALVETVKSPIHVAIADAAVTTVSSLVAITVGIATLATEAIQGTADFSQVAGPVGIVGLVGDAAEFGMTSLLMFTAIISLNLAVINMLPIPALDGGRLLFVAIEAIRRKPINPVWVARVNVAGFMALILLMLAVTVSDVSKLF